MDSMLSEHIYSTLSYVASRSSRERNNALSHNAEVTFGLVSVALICSSKSRFSVCMSSEAKATDCVMLQTNSLLHVTLHSLRFTLCSLSHSNMASDMFAFDSNVTRLQCELLNGQSFDSIVLRAFNCSSFVHYGHVCSSGIWICSNRMKLK